MSHVSTWRRVPNDPADWFSAEELDRARRYQRPLTRLRIVRAAMSLGVALAFIFGELGPRLLDALDIDGWALQLVVMVMALQVVSLLYDPVLDWWVDLVHDKEWGLSTQTPRGFLVDQAKSILLGLVLNLVLLIPLYWLVRTTDLWWFFGWLLVVTFSVLFGFLFPVLIAPIFNKFTPLEDEELVARIEAVADRAGVEIESVLVADESRRSRRDNAYVAGLGRTRRVVLYDTLLEHPHEIVEQVVAHEIGHWRLRHIVRQLPAVAAASFVVFLLLKLISEWQWLFERAGVAGIGDPAGLPILLLGVGAGFGLLGLATAWMSRAFERQADREALELLDAPAVMLDMQRRLHTKNLADLEPGIVQRLQASHPPAAERMAFTAAWADQRRAAGD